MTYIRKTIDEYDIEIKTSEGWEVVDCQPTRKNAQTSINTYRQEQPGYEYRIVKHRVKKENQGA